MKPILIFLLSCSVLFVVTKVPTTAQVPNPVILSTNPLTGGCPPRRFNVATASTSFKFCDPFLNAWTTVQSGGALPPTPQFVQTNTVTVTGVTTATTLVGTGTGSTTLPANFFSGVGSVLDIDYAGTWNGAGSATLDSYSLSLGGTAIINGSFTTTGTGTFGCGLRVTITARTVGVSGTVLAMTPGMLCGDATNSHVIQFGVVTTPVTINTTGTLAFNLTVTPGAVGKTYVTTNLVLRGY